jgi:uroporphyrinogen decarboxylase
MDRAEKIKQIIRQWTEEYSNGEDWQKINNWLKEVDSGKAIPLIDLINWIGPKENLRSLGLKILEEIGNMRLIDIVQLAGRRMAFPLALSVAAKLCNTTIRENILGGAGRKFETMYNTSQIIESDIAMCTFVDLSVIAEPFGCKVEIPEDAVPMILDHPIKSKDDLKKFEQVDLSKSPRISENFQTTSMFAERFTGLKASCGAAPFTMAGVLLGAEDIARKTLKDPGLVKTVLDICVQMVVMDAKTQISCGADLIFLGDPTASLLSPKAYEEFAADYCRKAIEQIGKPVILHICGNTNHIIEKMCATGAQGISVDYLVDLPSIVSRVPEDVVIMGNINPAGKLLNGTPEEVANETKELMERMKGIPNYIGMSGCDIPFHTPKENILAMVRTMKSY